MIPLLFVYSHDSIFQAVKQESSQLAIRKTDKEGNSLFEQVVFDEAYLPKFRELFFDARSEVTKVLSAYIKDIPVDFSILEFQDFSKDKDFVLTLSMPDDYMTGLTSSIDSKIKQYLIAYITYRWLETKIPDAETYLDRSMKILDDIRSLLNRRNKRTRINHQLF